MPSPLNVFRKLLPSIIMMTLITMVSLSQECAYRCLSAGVYPAFSYEMIICHQLCHGNATADGSIATELNDQNIHIYYRYDISYDVERVLTKRPTA